MFWNFTVFFCCCLFLSLFSFFGTPTQKGLQKRRRDTHTNTAMRQENTHTLLLHVDLGAGRGLESFLALKKSVAKRV